MTIDLKSTPTRHARSRLGLDFTPTELRLLADSLGDYARALLDEADPAPAGTKIAREARLVTRLVGHLQRAQRA